MLNINEVKELIEDYNNEKNKNIKFNEDIAYFFFDENGTYLKEEDIEKIIGIDSSIDSEEFFIIIKGEKKEISELFLDLESGEDSFYIELEEDYDEDILEDIKKELEELINFINNKENE